MEVIPIADVNGEHEGTTTCEHEGTVNLNHVLACRLCGIPLESYQSDIVTVQSARRANSIMDEIAVAGGYTALRFDGEFVVYGKTENGITEEIFTKKEDDKKYRVLKVLKMVK